MMGWGGYEECGGVFTLGCANVRRLGSIFVYPLLAPYPIFSLFY